MARKKKKQRPVHRTGRKSHKSKGGKKLAKKKGKKKKRR